MNKQSEQHHDEVVNPSSQIMHFDSNEPLHLDAGVKLAPFQMAYNTYGTLNKDKSNAIYVCHALTGDHHVANTHPVTGKPGWWSTLIGPGKAVDTNIYFVICANVIGGCLGSTGPANINPETGKPYGISLPVITIGDMVRAQTMLIKKLGIEKLLAVIGASMGGMQVLEWAHRHGKLTHSAIPIATGARHSAQNIAFHEVGRQAIMADPNWHQGEYKTHQTVPKKGLAVARMAAHITYLSESALQRKFGRNLQDRDAKSFGFDADFQIESYLRYQGMSFVERFDANSYLYLTRAMDYFDLAADNGGALTSAFKNSNTRFCVVAFSSDWLFPPEESRAVVSALNAVGERVSYVEIETDKGHDAFLLDEPELWNAVEGFLTATRRHAGITIEAQM